MKLFNNTINGLTSSLLLNVGLTSAAEKFDPMQNRGGESLRSMASAQSCEPCSSICAFTPETGQ